MTTYETSEDYRADESPLCLCEIARIVEKHGLTLAEFLADSDKETFTRSDVLDWLGY